MKEKAENYSSCTLCTAAISSPILDGTNAFCCMGCHAVYNILATKNQLEGFRNNPLFIQALKCGIISNPVLLEQIQRQREEVASEELQKLYLEVEEMWCPSCAEVIKLILLQEKGVVNCVVDYASDFASIEFSPRHLSKDKIISIIKRLGYRPKLFADQRGKTVSKDLYFRFGVAAFCALNVMMFAYPLYATYFDLDGKSYGMLFAWLSFLASLPVLFYSAWPIWRRFWLSIKTGFYGMETLVAIGVWSAFVLSIYELWIDSPYVYFDSMAVIIVFVLLGKIIESKAKFSAKESLLNLARATPRRGRKVFKDGSVRFVSVKEIIKGDVIQVFSGERICLDGKVLAGSGSCDESLMTGEVIPVQKNPGDTLIGGTILVQGNLTYAVLNDPSDMMLQKIIEMIETDIGRKSVYVRAADAIVRWFVPVVVVLALLTGVLSFAFLNTSEIEALMRALSVLLISCPCAIGIAAPAAESHLINGLAALGAIVRNRGSLSHLGKENMFVFDKTGTVTEGRFKLLSGLENLHSYERRALYTLASHSIHPIASAIAQALSKEEPFPIQAAEEVAGHGMKGIINGIPYHLGSVRYFSRLGIDLLQNHTLESQSIETIVYFAKENSCITSLKLGDKVRSEITGLLKDLKPCKTILLSGDSENAVSNVARLTGFDSWRAACTPLEKREFVDQLRSQGNTICMIGDGINDAPALTAANIGISVVSAAEMSIQVSDILLTTDKLSVLSKMRSLALLGNKIIRQNLFWAFFYNVIGIFLAAFGCLSPIFAAFAMSVSSLTVLFNARRLKNRW